MSILRPTNSVRFQLTVPTLTHIDLSGAGTVEATVLSADHLTLVESGARAITITELNANETTVEMSEASTIELAGEVTSQSIETSGSGNYLAGKLAGATAAVTLSGAGDVTLWVSEQLDAEISGAGSLQYYGSPQANAASSNASKVQSLGSR